MGREVKRVPLDFDWPLNTVWEGYLNPFYKFMSECEHCKNGFSAFAQQINDLWYGYVPFKPEYNGSVPFTVEHPSIKQLAIKNVGENYLHEAERLRYIFNSKLSCHLNQNEVDVLVKEGRLSDFKRAGIENPTAAQVNDWSISGLGHDSMNCWIITKYRCEQANEPTACQHCEGDAEIWPSNAHKVLANLYVPIQPPTGEAYQLWSTTSEGSPVSPPFKTPEELAKYLTENKVSSFGRNTHDHTTWLDFINTESPVCLDMIVTNVGVFTGLDINKLK